MQISHSLTGNRQKKKNKTVGRLPDTPAGGLSQGEAAARREQYGYNELPEEKRSAIKQLLSYFWGPIPWMIETAAILSALVRHWEDLAIILTLLLVNAAVGFWEEHQAGNTIAALKKKLAHQARVCRAGEWQTVPARELVPGDLIWLRLGDIVPADAVLGEGDPVEVDQSALTGESLPVRHKTGETVYAGSVLRQGEIDAIVNATGHRTYFGKTAELVKTDQPASHFQQAVLRIGNFLIILALALAVVILVAAVLRGDTLTTTLQFVLVLTVAAIPVAMPTVLSVTMAAGARLLARREAVVSRLASIEEMAGIDVLCSDKTGTLTQNRLTLGDPYTSEGIQTEQVVLAAALASRAEDGDPIDQAILSGLKGSARLGSYQVLHFQPFDPVHKRTEASVKSPDGRQFKVSKGAPQVILSLAGRLPEVQSQAETAIDSFARRGFRSLGVCQTAEGGDWQFLGILPLYDPPREDSKATIEAAESMGVKVKMVTGDQASIAREIAGQLGLGKNILNADLFPAGEADAQQVNEMIESADGFAQVFPEHKYNIVKALQASGHYVGMTGDGVNDAPALKAADAGVAVSGATDAARSAADIVLLTPGLSIIVEAIKESRKIFKRMNSYAIYRIAETVRVLLFMTLSILVFNFYPVTAVMIVLLALLNDGAILSIATDNVMYASHPEKWNMRQTLGIASVLGVTGVLASFGLFYLAERVFHIDRATIQTLLYLKLSVAGHLTIFITRTRGPFWSIRPSRLLLAAVGGTQFIATLIAVYGVLMSPIGWGWALAVWGYALAWFLINDRVKLLAYHMLERIQGGKDSSQGNNAN